jgi:membrane protein DedA with SNARE-associated domain
MNEVFCGHGALVLYGMTLLILVVCGLGLPIPEEATFLAAGYACTKINASVWILCVIGVVGILLGDSIPFYIGSRYGTSVLRMRFFAKFLSEKNRLRVQGFFHGHGSKTVFIARFVAGLRMPTYFMAGSMGVKYRTFVMWDLLGALISCPTSIWLAYKFGKEIESTLAKSHLYIFGFLGLIVLCSVYHVWSHREKKSPAAVDAATGRAGEGDVLIQTSQSHAAQSAAPENVEQQY